MLNGFKHKAVLLIALLWCSSSIGSQICLSETEIPPTTPTSQFTQHSNGTVTDTATKLMWMRCSVGLTWDGTTCQGEPSEHNWESALEVAKGTNFANYHDWRLPNIKELTSIVEEACHNPAINLTVFPETVVYAPDENGFPLAPWLGYWTSTHYSNDRALHVKFQNGFYTFYYKRDTAYRVRLVRGG